MSDNVSAYDIRQIDISSQKMKEMRRIYVAMLQFTSLSKWKQNSFEFTPYISYLTTSLSGVPDYFYRNKISSGGHLSHYSSASLY